MNNKEYLYEIIKWPWIQAYMNCEGFDDNCYLAPCDKFGSSAYFCNVAWLESLKSSSLI